MDARFQITASPRAGVPEGLAETPLITLAWRALRAEHQRRAEAGRQAEAEAQHTQAMLAGFAEEVYRLRCAARLVQAVLETSGRRVEAQQLVTAVDRLEQTLTQAELVILAPEGQVFTPELMELLENIAQQPKPEVREPYIAEVIAPAILYRGALLRMGKAIIAVPG